MTTVERLPWDVFADRLTWRQGEHVTLIGPTGCGKTTLALSLLERRKFVVAFGTKPRDRTLDGLVRTGWHRIKTIDERPGITPNARGDLPPCRCIVWPRYREMSDQANQAPVFAEAMSQLFVERNWTVFADEVGYLTRTLGLKAQLEHWWLQGRSIGLTLVAATQRPAWVPLEAYSQASHLFLWRTTDRRDLDRLRDISGPVGLAEIRDVITGLDYRGHEALYVNTKTGELVVTVPPKR